MVWVSRRCAPPTPEGLAWRSTGVRGGGPCRPPCRRPPEGSPVGAPEVTQRSQAGRSWFPGCRSAPDVARGGGRLFWHTGFGGPRKRVSSSGVQRSAGPAPCFERALAGQAHGGRGGPFLRREHHGAEFWGAFWGIEEDATAWMLSMRYSHPGVCCGATAS